MHAARRKARILPRLLPRTPLPLLLQLLLSIRPVVLATTLPNFITMFGVVPLSRRPLFLRVCAMLGAQLRVLLVPVRVTPTLVPLPLRSTVTLRVRVTLHLAALSLVGPVHLGIGSVSMSRL
ncbi:MAG: hypothetical protein CMH35_03815 [Microbacterium sp.]|nr:hypothetical protein [Microbacterium sp.]